MYCIILELDADKTQNGVPLQLVPLFSSSNVLSRAVVIWMLINGQFRLDG